ncbi:hypothetical protein [Enterococcus sp. BWR-S5]|uniref:hypothetical protein n=1 Tax=Enterococcus sp. BWR-S5 TaxID=2787714 RepID=UPI001921C63E|nr:hypothetical protein [Enterococcus sp. BWR-S5]MBL1225860.1 hypothetical protein [Enterococcus sp. BWR-S5]
MRISGIHNLDTSINQFELVLSRLNGSMITIFDSKGNKVIGVSNPSVNDYLRKIFYDNQVELERMKESILHFEQIFRCYDQEDANRILKKMLLNEKILELEFDSFAVKTYILSVIATKNRVMKPGYQVYIDNFLTSYESKIAHLYSKQDMLSDIFMTLLEEELYQYYNISKYLSNRDKLKQIINKIELEDLSTIVNRLWKKLHEKRVMHLGNIKDYLAFFNETILEKISDWMMNLSIAEILDNTDMEDVVNDNKEINSDGEVEYNEYEIEEEAKDQIKQYCIDEITNHLKPIKFINWEQVEDTIEKSDILDIDFDDIVVEIYDNSDDEELYTPELLKEDRARLEAQESLNYQDEIDSIFDR